MNADVCEAVVPYVGLVVTVNSPFPAASPIADSDV
jgi:hypothetical protein